MDKFIQNDHFDIPQTKSCLISKFLLFTNQAPFSGKAENEKY